MDGRTAQLQRRRRKKEEKEEGREKEEKEKNPFPSYQFGSTVLIVRAGITGQEKEGVNPEKGVFRYGKHMCHKCLSGRQSLKDVLVSLPVAVIKIP